MTAREILDQCTVAREIRGNDTILYINPVLAEELITKAIEEAKAEKDKRRPS